ncbi:MAG: ABC transporter ATP-binding protein [Bdellovibrionia bacterium]
MFKQISKVLVEVKTYKKYLIIIATTGIIYSLAYSRLALLVKDLFDQLSAGSHSQILYLAPIAIGLSFTSSLSRYFHIYLMNYVAECVVQSLRLKLQKKFMSLSLSYHNNYSQGSGGLISRILNDIRTIQDSLRLVADFFLHPLLFVFLIGNLLYIDWQLTLLTFTVLPVVALFLRSVAKSLRKYSPRAQVALEKMTATIKESLDGVRVIQSFNLEKEMGNKLENEAADYLRIRKTHHSRQEATGPVTEFIATTVIMLVLIYISNKIGAGKATPGTFIGFITSLMMLNQPLKKFQEAFIRMQEVVVAIERLFEIIDSDQEVPQANSKKDFPKDWSTIDYKNVHFSYENNAILKGVDLTIKRGEVVAFVGESGSGKSTLVNLLERFYDPQSGAITIDNLPIQEIQLTDLRKNIGLVSQDVFLFSDTIERNIWAGDFTRSPKDIQEVAKLANAHEFIMKMPEQYQSPVGDRGGLLSGGEKQRVSIARALFKNAPILILDEATSALDTTSEIEVQKGLEILMKGRTALVIAHRLSTIQNADKIVVMHQGQIVEIGKHQELLEKKGHYFKLHSMQYRV